MPLTLNIFLLVITLFAAAYYGLQAYHDWQATETAEKSRLEYERLALVTTWVTPTRAPKPTPEPLPTATPEATPTPTLSPTPTPRAITPLFKAIREEYGNDDIVGYLKIDGTSIDYLVTQSDDNALYLANDIYRNESSAGWIFMDYENDITRDDPNTVIYGHNMRKDIMFHALRNYQSKDYFESHRFVTFNTAFEDGVWEVFSFYRTSIYFAYVQVLFDTEEDFLNMAGEMKSRSMYDTGVTVNPGDRILTLSTCTNEREDTRFVLNAKLVKQEPEPSRPGEGAWTQKPHSLER
jgi:sortase B